MLERTERSERAAPRSQVVWGLCLFAVVGIILWALDMSWGAGLALIVVVGVLAIWQFPYAGFFAALASAPLLGLMISIPVSSLRIGERALGGSIDVSAGEIVAAFVLLAWALRVFFFGLASRERVSRLWLPLGGTYALLVAAQVLSVVSPAFPDPWVVMKYALRPVLFVYLVGVVLTVNFVRSRRRLKQALFVWGSVGGLCAVDGWMSLFFLGGDASGVYRAHPLTWFSRVPLGGNHHALAELLIPAAACLLALAALTHARAFRRCLQVAAGFLTLITLLTFARAAWFVLALELVALWATVWRGWFHRSRRMLWSLFVLFTPLFIYMAVFSASAMVKSSTDARSLLTGIAVHLWQDSPWIGVGAGTFAERVSHIWAFAIEYGAPQDAHGMIQKVGAETGLVGLAALLGVVLALIGWLRHFWNKIREPEARQAYTFLLIGLLGSATYQLFSSSFWTARLWVPVGLALAAGRVLSHRANARDPDFLTSGHV